MIYIVTDGDYSSYHIERVFKTRAEAEKYKKFYDRVNRFNSCNIEEWEFGCEYPKIRVWSARFGRYRLGEGWTDDHMEVEEVDPRENKVTAFELRDWPGAGVGPNNAWLFEQVIEAPDQAHAKKIFQDNVAKFMAEREGL